MKNKNIRESVAENLGINEGSGCCCGDCRCSVDENNNTCQNDRCQCATEQEDTAKIAEETGIEQKFEELQDRYLRLSAEFDNFRKRTARERLDMIVCAGEDIITGLLPVIDDFERAIKSVETQGVNETQLEGIKLIYQKTMDYLKTKGLQEIDVSLIDFDTDLHDAITKFPASAPEQKGKIIDTVQKGYKLGDKVIRYAKVVVGE